MRDGIAVYVTTFNRLPLLKRAIESVEAQTLAASQIIVCDDGSTDGSREFLLKWASLKDSNIAIFNDPPHQGACVGRNAAIFSADCKYITGLDDDDYFEPWRLEKFMSAYQTKRSKSERFAGLFDRAVEIREKGSFKCFDVDNVSYETLRLGNIMGNQIFIELDKLKSIGGFDPEMPALQDWDTWLRLAKKYGQFTNIFQDSYVMIQNHGGARISEKSPDTIRQAFDRLRKKLSPLSFKEKVNFIHMLYNYHQIDLRFAELLLLISGFKIRRLAQVFKRKIVGTFHAAKD